MVLQFSIADFQVSELFSGDQFTVLLAFEPGSHSESLSSDPIFYSEYSISFLSLLLDFVNLSFIFIMLQRVARSASRNLQQSDLHSLEPTTIIPDHDSPRDDDLQQEAFDHRAPTHQESSRGSRESSQLPSLQSEELSPRETFVENPEEGLIQEVGANEDAEDRKGFQDGPAFPDSPILGNIFPQEDRRLTVPSPQALVDTLTFSMRNMIQETVTKYMVEKLPSTISAVKRRKMQRLPSSSPSPSDSDQGENGPAFPTQPQAVHQPVSPRENIKSPRGNIKNDKSEPDSASIPVKGSLLVPMSILCACRPSERENYNRFNAKPGGADKWHARAFARWYLKEI